MPKRIVWTAVAVYAPEDDVDPLVAVGHSKEAAENALQWRLMVHCQDDAECIEQWIAYTAEEHTFED
jgi:hypothetical protein